MDLKEFRKDYGQNVSMTVCRAAQCYVLNGHMPKPALGCASTIYAKDFVDNPTYYSSYQVEAGPSCIEVYQLQTESALAQKVLREGRWEYSNRSACIARLGENYKQDLVKKVVCSDGSVVSFYNHLGRFVSIVALEGHTEDSQTAEFNKIGHILTLNALGYYRRYLDAAERSKKHNSQASLNGFDSYLLAQPLELTPERYYGQNNYFTRPQDEIGKYLEQKSSELGTQISIGFIEILGDFDRY